VGKPEQAQVDLGYGPRRFPRFRGALAIFIARALVRPIFRLRVEGLELLPRGSSIVCFNHLNWADPIVLLAAMPSRPRLYFFGPKEIDMGVGARNRLMRWAGNAVAYQPGNRDMVTAVRRVQGLMTAGSRLAIAGEGRIHVGESVVPPLSEGPAFFALRTGVPIVPVAINGTSWLSFGRRLRVRIGQPVAVAGLDRRRDVAAVTAQVRERLAALVADYPDPSPPSPFWRWLTETFNDWPEGSRPPSPGAK
jgi:1-acyl-sn-glycerol-3-phosphate acyltransferase